MSDQDNIASEPNESYNAEPVKRKFGGVQPGAGRPPKVEEMQAAKKSISGIIAVYGSEENFWKFIAEKSLESFPHLSVLIQYGYGRPTESKEINIKTLPSVQAILISNNEIDASISEDSQD